MSKDQKILLWINLLGGSAVIGSYAWGILTHPGTGNLLLGNIPSTAIPAYIVSMIFGALGYLFFTSYFIFFFKPSEMTIQTKAGFRGIHTLYLLILIPSALWMPLTYAMVSSPSSFLWISIRFSLMLVGLGGLGMVSTFLVIRPRSRLLLAAVISCIFFCFQTAFLDAFIWPSYFVLP